MFFILSFDCSEVRSSAFGVFLLNLCISLLCLYISYTISHFVGNSESACKAFSFIFHYFILVSCMAVPIVAFFTGWTPFSGKKQQLCYVAALILNWSMFAYCGMFPYLIHQFSSQCFRLWW